MIIRNCPAINICNCKETNSCLLKQNNRSKQGKFIIPTGNGKIRRSR